MDADAECDDPQLTRDDMLQSRKRPAMTREVVPVLVVEDTAVKQP